MGRMMRDKRGRVWDVVGRNVKYGLMMKKERIVEKSGDGGVDVYDGEMNGVKK